MKPSVGNPQNGDGSVDIWERVWLAKINASSKWEVPADPPECACLSPEAKKARPGRWVSPQVWEGKRRSKNREALSRFSPTYWWPAWFSSLSLRGEGCFAF